MAENGAADAKQNIVKSPSTTFKARLEQYHVSFGFVVHKTIFHVVLDCHALLMSS